MRAASPDRPLLCTAAAAAAGVRGAIGLLPSATMSALRKPSAAPDAKSALAAEAVCRAPACSGLILAC